MKKRLHIALPLLASSLLLGGCGATYNIRFVDEDGTELFFGEFKKGETPKYNAATPTKASTNTTNYTFAGWDKTVGPATEAATYTATYNESVRKYSVKFLDADGSVIKTEYCEYNSMPTAPYPSVPVEPHKVYTFAGWDKQITPVTSDAVYTARYTYQYVYTFKFYNGTTKTVELNPGVSIQQHLLANTADYTDGHVRLEFDGWTSDDGYYFTEKVKSTNIVFLTYQVVVVDGDGTEKWTNSNPQYVEEKTNLQLKAAVLEGYDFVGWYLDKDYISSPVDHIDDITEDYTLYGKLLIHTYNISYELNGGQNDSENPTTYKVKDGTVELNEPTKYGYTFDKWVIKGTTSKKSSIGIKDFSNGDITLEAVWKAITVKATFKLNDGYYAKTVTYMDGNLPIYQQQIDRYNKLNTIPYYRDGYQLAGWTKTKNSTELYDFDEVISEDMKLYAVLVPVEKGATSGQINANNFVTIEGLKTKVIQVTSMIDQTLTFESLSAFNTINTVGYLLDKNGNTLAADNDSGFANNFRLSYEVKKGQTYYLHVRGDSNEDSGDAMVSITSNKQSILPTSNVYGSYDDTFEVTFTFGQKANVLPAPMNFGHTFLGWKTENGVWYTSQTVVNVDEPIVLTAMWM